MTTTLTAIVWTWRLAILHHLMVHQLFEAKVLNTLRSDIYSDAQRPQEQVED